MSLARFGVSLIASSSDGKALDCSYDLKIAPLPDYSIGRADLSIVHQSGYYLLSGVIGATGTYIVMLIVNLIHEHIHKNENEEHSHFHSHYFW